MKNNRVRRNGEYGEWLGVKKKKQQLLSSFGVFVFVLRSTVAEYRLQPDPQDSFDVSEFTHQEIVI